MSRAGSARVRPIRNALNWDGRKSKSTTGCGSKTRTIFCCQQSRMFRLLIGQQGSCSISPPACRTCNKTSFTVCCRTLYSEGCALQRVVNNVESPNTYLPPCRYRMQGVENRYLGPNTYLPHLAATLVVTKKCQIWIARLLTSQHSPIAANMQKSIMVVHYPHHVL